MTRSVPAINGTPQFMRISWRFIDITGDKRAISALVPAGTTVATIEALTELLGENTHANLYSVEQQAVYDGDGSKSLASAGNHSSVYDNIVILFRNGTTRQTQDMFIPAPDDALFVENTDTPNMDPAGAFMDITSAFETLLGAAAYNPISTRFTERREINQAEKY